MGLVQKIDVASRAVYIDAKGSGLVMASELINGEYYPKKVLRVGQLTDAQRLADLDLLTIAGAQIMSKDTGLIWQSNGTSWAVIPASPLIFQSGSAVYLLSAGTISATGLLTNLAALNYTPSGVVQVYMYGLNGLVAGLYYARFSSTTSCQLYSDLAGTTVLSGVTPGAYASGTVEVVLKTILLPPNVMGANGSCDIWWTMVYSNTGNVKGSSAKFAGNHMSGSGTNAGVGSRVFCRITNKNDTNRQQTLDNSAQATGAAGASYTYAVDTTQSVPITITGALTNTADFLIIENVTVTVNPT